MVSAPPDRNIAAMVGRLVLLFVGAVLFLIHHDEPQGLKRQEYGRAGSDHNPCPALSHHPVLFVFLLRVETAVINRKGIAEPARHPFDHLRRQGDFGNQDQYLLSLLQSFFCHMQIDFRLSASGHAMKQKHLARILQHLFHRLLLKRAEIGRLIVFGIPLSLRFPLFFKSDQSTFVHQGFGGTWIMTAKARVKHRFTAADKKKRLQLFRRQANFHVGSFHPGLLHGRFRLPAGFDLRRQHRLIAGNRGAYRDVLHIAGQGAKLGSDQGFPIENRKHRLDLLRHFLRFSDGFHKSRNRTVIEIDKYPDTGLGRLF